MKLYDGGRAPNPRTVRVFLKEKGIEIPVEQVDLGAMQHKSERYTALNPLQRVPALELDDGTIIHRIHRHLPVFRGAVSGAGLVRADARWKSPPPRCGSGGSNCICC